MRILGLILFIPIVVGQPAPTMAGDAVDLRGKQGVVDPGSLKASDPKQPAVVYTPPPPPPAPPPPPSRPSVPAAVRD